MGGHPGAVHGPAQRARRSKVASPNKNTYGRAVRLFDKVLDEVRPVVSTWDKGGIRAPPTESAFRRATKIAVSVRRRPIRFLRIKDSGAGRPGGASPPAVAAARLVVGKNVWRARAWQRTYRIPAVGTIVVHSTTKYINGHSGQHSAGVVTPVRKDDARSYRLAVCGRNAEGAISSARWNFVARSALGPKTNLALRMGARQRERPRAAPVPLRGTSKGSGTCTLPGLPSPSPRQTRWPASRLATCFGGGEDAFRILGSLRQGGRAGMLNSVTCTPTHCLVFFFCDKSLRGVEGSLISHPAKIKARRLVAGG